MILVTGATGYTGRFVVARLLTDGQRLRLLVRSESEESRRLAASGDVEIHIGDLTAPETVRPACDGIEKVVSIASIRFAPALASVLNGDAIEHVVAVSSLRRFSAVPSVTVVEVEDGEAALIESGLPVTILRPSMIFGPGNDHNISKLLIHLRHRRWIPVFGDGLGLQQPVYVEDVASAIAASLQRTAIVRGNQYAIAGPEPLSYIEMVGNLAEVVGARPRTVRIPLGLATAVLTAAERLGFKPPLTAEQVMRLQEDKFYDIGPARRDLDYDPLPFRTALQRIYRTAYQK